MTQQPAEAQGNGSVSWVGTVGPRAAPPEQQAASRLIEESLKAREEGDWATQCETLVASYAKEVGESAPGSEKTCVASLESLAETLDEAAFASTMTKPLVAMRVNDNQAFAFYEGARGVYYVMPLQREGGEWKLASITEEVLF